MLKGLASVVGTVGIFLLAGDALLAAMVAIG
jgi:hypothetical protein